jgi:phage baseplate assembly protein gpV
MVVVDVLVNAVVVVVRVVLVSVVAVMEVEVVVSVVVVSEAVVVVVAVAVVPVTVVEVVVHPPASAASELSQTLHARSEVLVAGTATNSPGRQSVKGVHLQREGTTTMTRKGNMRDTPSHDATRQHKFCHNTNVHAKHWS